VDSVSAHLPFTVDLLPLVLCQPTFRLVWWWDIRTSILVSAGAIQNSKVKTKVLQAKLATHFDLLKSLAATVLQIFRTNTNFDMIDETYNSPGGRGNLII
jgi:hypothetical protein